MTYRITLFIDNQLIMWFSGNLKVIYYQGTENCAEAYKI